MDETKKEKDLFPQYQEGEEGRVYSCEGEEGWNGERLIRVDFSTTPDKNSNTPTEITERSRTYTDKRGSLHRVRTFTESIMDELDRLGATIEKAHAEGMRKDQIISFTLGNDPFNLYEGLKLPLELWEAYHYTLSRAKHAYEELAQEKKEAEKKLALAEADKRKTEADKRKAQREQKRVEQKLEAMEQSLLPPYLSMPTSPASNFIMDLFSAGAEVDSFPETKTTDRKTKYTVLANGNARRMTLVSKTEEVSVEFDDIYRLMKSGKVEKNFFLLALMKVNEQALHKGELTRDTVTFSLQELVDLGMYSNKDSAAVGFNSAKDALTSLKVTGSSKRGKAKSIKAEAVAVLFPYAQIEGNMCCIGLNTFVGWGFLLQYYAPLPRYYFALSTRGQNLLYYISFLARQNTKKIAEHGYFTISVAALQQQLKLPRAEDTKNPKRDILQAIENALKDIEKYGKEDFTAELVYDRQKASVKEFCKTGYLKITPLGAYASSLLTHHRKREKTLAASEKKKEAIKTEALIRNTAKHMESNGNNET